MMLSGGMDSTVMAYYLKDQGFELYGVHINAGQPNFLQDRQAVNLISQKLHVPVEIIDVPGLVASYKGNLQPEFEEHSQPCCETTRPFIAPLSMAGVYADIAGFDNLYIAYLKEEIDDFQSRYANLNEVHMHFENMINAGRGTSFKIETPFMTKSKSDIVVLGQQLNVPLGSTWSCWNSFSLHCGTCAGCTGRKAAFSKNKSVDPTRYLA